MTKKTQHFSIAFYIGITLFATSAVVNASETGIEPTNKTYSFSEAASQSITGDVYSDAAAANWQDLSYSNLFSKGWNKPWVSPPTGGGGAPRQG